jgi:hypothetical protein
MSDLHDAVTVLAVTLRGCAYDVAVHFTCGEADALIQTFAVGGRREDAILWAEAHARNEDEETGDLHYKVRAEPYVAQLMGEKYEGSMFDHPVRVCDDPQPCNCCKDCGRPVTWMGSSGAWGSDWAHEEES